MMKQKPVVLRQRRQEEGLSHEIMGNSVINQKRKEFAVKRRAASSQDQEATKEDTWSSNPSKKKTIGPNPAIKKVGHLSQSFGSKKLLILK